MNLYESPQSGKRRSRGKNNAKGRNTSGHKSSSSGRSSSSRNSSGRNRSHNAEPNYMKLAVGGVILILVILCIAALLKGMSGEMSETEPETTTVAETELVQEVTVEGIRITGMSSAEAREALKEKLNWGMLVTYQEEQCELSDMLSSRIEEVITDVYSGGTPKESYTIDMTGLDDQITQEAAKVAAKWDKKAKNGSISSYDSSTGEFIFTGAEQGQAVDQEKLAADIKTAIGQKDFAASIEATVNPVEPEFSEATAKEKYKTIGSFTTKTTANSKRNTNIKLAAQALNGTVLQPGEEFSFNDVVGERTEAKGYMGAAAYNNGEVVEEIGGGVCQVSSTLYNAVLKSGLNTTYRRSHTYEPSYVTPGTDATVSWGGPDYKFQNNSSAAVGIRASYSDQTVTISIYGIPILEDGVKYALKSTKIKDIDSPVPTYEEDGTLEPGVEKTKSSGSKGSQWETRLVITKNDEVISQNVDHTVTYKGHAPVILRNTSGTVAATEPIETTPAETIIDPNAESSPAGDPNQGITEGPGGGPGVKPEENPSPTTSAQSGVVDGPGGNVNPTIAPTTAEETQPAPTIQEAPTDGNSGTNIIPGPPGA